MVSDLTKSSGKSFVSDTSQMTQTFLHWGCEWYEQLQFLSGLWKVLLVHILVPHFRDSLLTGGIWPGFGLAFWSTDLWTNRCCVLCFALLFFFLRRKRLQGTFRASWFFLLPPFWYNCTYANPWRCLSSPFLGVSLEFELYFVSYFPSSLIS